MVRLVCLINVASRPVGEDLNEFVDLDMKQSIQTLSGPVDLLLHGACMAKITFKECLQISGSAPI